MYTNKRCIPDNNITLFDADERKFNYVKCREGMIKKVLHLIWRLIFLDRLESFRIFIQMWTLEVVLYIK